MQKTNITTLKEIEDLLKKQRPQWRTFWGATGILPFSSDNLRRIPINPSNHANGAKVLIVCDRNDNNIAEFWKGYYKSDESSIIGYSSWYRTFDGAGYATMSSAENILKGLGLDFWQTN